MLAHHIELSCRTLKPKLSAMKFLVILALVAFVAARPDKTENSEVYTRYETFDGAPIRENKRSLTSFTKCFVGEGKCTAEALDFKKLIPEAIQSNCGKCTEHQKREVALFIKAIIDKRAEDWKKLNNTYNPDGKYTEGFQKFIDQYAKEDKN